MLLVDRRRILLLEAICQEYLALLMNQTVLAEVISAIELTELNSSQSAKGQKHDQCSRSRTWCQIDRDLIGGVIIKVGSQEWC